MKMKRILSALMSLILVFTCAAGAAAASFPDASDHWATGAIDYMAGKKVLNGFEDGTFRPEESVTRVQFIKMLDVVVPGFASDETLLYSPELKFYSNKVRMDENLNTNIAGLHCLGDSSGWTRGLMMASASGVQMARNLVDTI